jgi:hypothetical protein
MTRREYTSGRPTTIDSPFAISAGTFTIADDGSQATWPTGESHPFWVTIDAGTAQEERVLCSGRSARVVTVASGGRGQDGTSESNHTAGATVWPSWSATDADESNEHINALAGTGVHGLTATATELNYATGVTSSIQTQLNTLRTNDFNQIVSNKTASYTLVATDKGTRVVMNSASATTITVNTGLFNAGDTLFIQNIGAGPCTITAGTATVTSAGSLQIPQWAGGTLYFTSAGAAIFFLAGSLPRAAYSATTGSPVVTTVSGKTCLQFNASGSITISLGGLLDALLIGGGGGGTNASSGLGGGGGGFIYETNYFVPAGTYSVTVGNATAGQKGGDSVFDKLFAIGGGKGASTLDRSGNFGGSGGGTTVLGGQYSVSGQGNPGGTNLTGNQGGGGAGGAGGTGAAGAGLANSITGASVTYSAGGTPTGGAGAANTGNGGGGNANNAGGTGVVILLIG